MVLRRRPRPRTAKRVPFTRMHAYRYFYIIFNFIAAPISFPARFLPGKESQQLVVSGYRKRHRVTEIRVARAVDDRGEDVLETQQLESYRDEHDAIHFSVTFSFERDDSKFSQNRKRDTPSECRII